MTKLPSSSAAMRFTSASPPQCATANKRTLRDEKSRRPASREPRDSPDRAKGPADQARGTDPFRRNEPELPEDAERVDLLPGLADQALLEAPPDDLGGIDRGPGGREAEVPPAVRHAHSHAADDGLAGGERLLHLHRDVRESGPDPFDERLPFVETTDGLRLRRRMEDVVGVIRDVDEGEVALVPDALVDLAESALVRFGRAAEAARAHATRPALPSPAPDRAAAA